MLARLIAAGLVLAIDPRGGLLRVFTDWVTQQRIAELEGEIRELRTRVNFAQQLLEEFMSASTDAWAELDGQVDALDAYVKGEDQATAADIAKRTQRIRDLLASVNPTNDAPAPGQPGAPVPDPNAPVPTDGGTNVDPDDPSEL